jgi:hypothetical protein
MFVPLTIDQMAERLCPTHPRWDKSTLFYWATHPQYTTYTIEKKSHALEKAITLEDDGPLLTVDIPAPKVRLISEPACALKAIQTWILQFVLNPACASLLPCVHGCVPGRSTVTNAMPHVGSRFKIHMDVKDFFPTVTAPRVYGLFKNVFGYDNKLSWLLANLCTWKRPALEGQPEMAQSLPQGAPTSPAIANLISTGLDIKMLRLMRGCGGTYTRYVDDLTFSFKSGMGQAWRDRLVNSVAGIVSREGFEINEAKTSIVGRRSRMVVTGVVVNSKPSIPKEFRSRLRASLHHARLELPTADAAHVIQGRIAYVQMVNPAQAARVLR